MARRRRRIANKKRSRRKASGARAQGACAKPRPRIEGGNTETGNGVAATGCIKTNQTRQTGLRDEPAFPGRSPSHHRPREEQ
jgi:hypothetical protein